MKSDELTKNKCEKPDNKFGLNKSKYSFTRILFFSGYSLENSLLFEWLNIL